MSKLVRTRRFSWPADAVNDVIAAVPVGGEPVGARPRAVVIPAVIVAAIVERALVVAAVALPRPSELSAVATFDDIVMRRALGCTLASR